MLILYSIIKIISYRNYIQLIFEAYAGFRTPS